MKRCLLCEDGYPVILVNGERFHEAFEITFRCTEEQKFTLDEALAFLQENFEPKTFADYGRSWTLYPDGRLEENK